MRFKDAYEKEAGVKGGLLACAPQLSAAAAVYESAAFWALPLRSFWTIHSAPSGGLEVF